MAKYKVTTPAAGHTGAVGKVHFVDGVAEVDGETHAAELAYFHAQGYGVEEVESAESPAPKRRAPARSKTGDGEKPAGDGDGKGDEKPADGGEKDKETSK
jgi:hypothetical protein